MDETTLAQAIDFQSIAVEQLEKGNYDMAQDFAEDVLQMLQEEQES
jgi:hypothetical protein